MCIVIFIDIIFGVNTPLKSLEFTLPSYFLQADSGREGEHRASCWRNREQSQQRGSGWPSSPPVLSGTGQHRPWLHPPIPHILHPGIAFSTQLRALHSPPAPLPSARDRQTGRSMCVIIHKHCYHTLNKRLHSAHQNNKDDDRSLALLDSTPPPTPRALRLDRMTHTHPGAMLDDSREFRRCIKRLARKPSLHRTEIALYKMSFPSHFSLF